MPTSTPTHAIRIHETGGPEVLRWEPITLPPPGIGEIRIRHTAVGLNYIDTYFRSGLYPQKLPGGIGSEGAGVVEELGAGVTNVKVGDRVAYGTSPSGSYAEARNLEAKIVVKIPDGIDDRVAAAAMLKGMTAQYLVRRTYPVQKGDTILVHAAAGGTGLLVCQWAKHLGATVIGTVGSEEKAKLAQAHGAAHTIFYRTEDVVARVKEITGGKGVPVVYDSVGKDTFLTSIDCLRPRGMMVTFGNASGPAAPIDPRLLSQKGSLYLTRPTLFDYTRERAELEETAREVFEVIAGGALKVHIAQTYALRDAEAAHRDLESRKTSGASVLLP